MTTIDMDTGNGEPTTATATEFEEGQTTEPRQETKLKFGAIIPCVDCGKHGTVYFVGNEAKEGANNFDDIDRICRMMDDESVQKFRSVVTRLQDQGKLEDLLAPEIREEKRRQAQLRQQRLEDSRQNLLDRLKNLDEDAARVQAAGLSNHALAMTVIDHLTEALSKAGLKEAILDEMSERDMDIRVSVTIDDDRQVVNLVINPQDLIREDVSDGRAAMKADLMDIMNEATKELF